MMIEKYINWKLYLIFDNFKEVAVVDERRGQDLKFLK